MVSADHSRAVGLALQEDAELEAIRQRRMAELARQRGGGGGGGGGGAGPMTPEEQEEQEAAKQ